MNPSPNPAHWPIDGTLDLHLFQPAEVGDLVPGYLDECLWRPLSLQDRAACDLF